MVSSAVAMAQPMRMEPGRTLSKSSSKFYRDQLTGGNVFRKAKLNSELIPLLALFYDHQMQLKKGAV